MLFLDEQQLSSPSCVCVRRTAMLPGKKIAVLICASISISVSITSPVLSSTRMYADADAWCEWASESVNKTRQFTQDAGRDAHANWNANPLMLLACNVNTPIDNNRSHLLVLHCTSRCASCVNGALPCSSFLDTSTRSMTGMAYAPVLPVPFFARARMSRPDSAIGMDASWMGDGFSQPEQRYTTLATVIDKRRWSAGKAGEGLGAPKCRGKTASWMGHGFPEPTHRHSKYCCPVGGGGGRGSARGLTISRPESAVDPNAAKAKTGTNQDNTVTSRLPLSPASQVRV